MKNSRVVVLTDLDDSLFQTLRKIPKDTDFKPVAFDKNKEPLSYMSHPQSLLWDMLLNYSSDIIPITGRNLDALNRVQLPFGTYRSVSHGSIVLNKDNKLCEDYWFDYLNIDSDQLKQICQKNHKLNEYISFLIEKNKLNLRTKLITEYGFSQYVSIKGDKEDLEFISKNICNTTLLKKFRFHLNDKNMAYIPSIFCKKKAAIYILNKLNVDSNDLVLTIGDSISDLNMMCTGFYAILPTKSQIFKEKFHL